MSLLLSSVISNAARTQQPFVLFQSSLAQSCIPLFCSAFAQSKCKVLLFCLLYPPNALAKDLAADQIEVFDLTADVPGYAEEPLNVQEYILHTIDSYAAGPFTIAIDSMDTLMSNLGSLAATQMLLKRLLTTILSRGGKSRLLVHMLASSSLKDSLMQTTFSPTLAAVISYPPALIKHVATDYMTLPPPMSTPEKFWSVFLPIAQRQYESEALVFGINGDGPQMNELVVEVLIRGADGSGRRRGIDRVLEGWLTSAESACDLRQLGSLSKLWRETPLEQQNVPDPAHNATFNLNLTPQQQESRSQVPLPYTLEAKSAAVPQAAAIYYDPDSADDIDDDDPDEDLDI